jgi:hypothetical protein
MEFNDLIAAVVWQHRKDSPQKRVQFVDIPISLHACVIFEEAFTAEQAGSSAVAAAGVYFHGFSLPSIDYQTLIVPTPNRTLAIRK